MKKSLFHWLCGSFILALTALVLFPFAYVLAQGFWTQDGFSLGAYYQVFWGTPRYTLRFWRSCAMATAVCAGQAAVSVPAGFAFAKCRFRGREPIFFLLMILMALPVQATLVPNYLSISRLGLLNTYAALILPSIFAPLGTFLLRQAFAAIPDAILESAMLDGCGVPRLILRVAVPMSGSGMACVVFLTFLNVWNMVEQPMIFLNDPDRYPLSVALAQAPTENPAVQMVCCLLAAVPPLALFTCFHRELIEGIALGEVK